MENTHNQLNVGQKQTNKNNPNTIDTHTRRTHARTTQEPTIVAQTKQGKNKQENIVQANSTLEKTLNAKNLATKSQKTNSIKGNKREEKGRNKKLITLYTRTLGDRPKKEQTFLTYALGIGLDILQEQHTHTKTRVNERSRRSKKKHRETTTRINLTNIINGKQNYLRNKKIHTHAQTTLPVFNTERTERWRTGRQPFDFCSILSVSVCVWGSALSPFPSGRPKDDGRSGLSL